MMNKKFSKLKDAYIELLSIRDRLRKLDSEFMDNETIKVIFSEIDRAELSVLNEWAEATKDINPHMLDDIEMKRLKWYPALDDYLARLLEL